MCPAPRYSIEQQAEMIRGAAEKVIEDSSLLDFKMTAIAKEAGLSVGSLYKYVQTKEDVIIALACEMFICFCDVADQIYSSAHLSMPEKLMSFMLLAPEKANRFSFDMDLEILATSDPVLRRCSPMWKAKMLELEDHMDSMCEQKTKDCFESGEYLGELEEVMEISMGNWAMTVGMRQVRSHMKIKEKHCQSNEEVCFAGEMAVKAMKRYINAYPWKAALTDDGIERAKKNLISLGLR
ncbi:hypothetical protein SOPP22_02050 [Shewanella sp. OPT22]|nr:hypothetical protein SOPP22_02050 [Shewanella sp. OPT22]